MCCQASEANLAPRQRDSARGGTSSCMEDSMEDEELLCFSGVRGCCGVDHLVIIGPTQSQCISCAFQDNACDAPSFGAHAEAMLAAGHSILDGEAFALASESAVRAVRAYAMQCPPFMDVTGGREWDCSLWLTALLSCANGRATAGVEPPDTVLELGAGAGGLAVRLVSDEGFAAALQLYTVTDVEGRVASLQVDTRTHMQRMRTARARPVYRVCTACAGAHRRPRPRRGAQRVGARMGHSGRLGVRAGARV